MTCSKKRNEHRKGERREKGKGREEHNSEGLFQVPLLPFGLQRKHTSRMYFPFRGISKKKKKKLKRRMMEREKERKT